MIDQDSKLSTTWLVARYHMPIVYSCRSPISSPTSGIALPTPGPGTVQLAMIRTGIEIFGLDYVRDHLFIQIIGCRPMICPPSAVAITEQVMKLQKADGNGHITEGIGYRQVAHALDEMAVYVNVDLSSEVQIVTLMQGIGYWGQSNSFASCIEVRRKAPVDDTCIRPAEEQGRVSAQMPFYTGYATEALEPTVMWEHLMAEHAQSQTLIRQRLYVWPLIVETRHVRGQVLRRHSLSGT